MNPSDDLGDDLETVQSTNVPAGRLAFRREVLAEEQRLMMLSTRRRSRSNTAESWFEEGRSRPPGLPNGVSKALPSDMLNMYEKLELEDVIEE